MENLTTARSASANNLKISKSEIKFPRIEPEKVIVTAKALDDFFAQLYGYNVGAIPTAKPGKMP